jgi:hypothetical protein
MKIFNAHRIPSLLKKVSLTLMAFLFSIFLYSQTKTEIRPAEISKNVAEYIAKNFSGYSVDKAFKVDSKGILSTEVMVTKGQEKLALTFDKNAKLTKKEAIRAEVKMPPAKTGQKPLPPVKK